MPSNLDGNYQSMLCLSLTRLKVDSKTEVMSLYDFKC